MMRATLRTSLRLAAIAATSIGAVGLDPQPFAGPAFRRVSKWNPAEAALANAFRRPDVEDKRLLSLDSQRASSQGAPQLPASSSESRMSSPHASASLWLLIALSFALFAFWGAQDVWHFVVLWRPGGPAIKTNISGSTAEKSPMPSSGSNYGTNRFAEQSLLRGVPPHTQWSTLSLVALMSYRFYTGFLSATWIPYLLAMEGQELWAEKQSVFMGFAKLIYGGTILLNPFFGLIGDSVATVAHFAGRRIFVRCGLLVAFTGIVICVIAEGRNALVTFMVGLFFWRIGEAINDVTTEALVPEIVPRDQFELASSIKSVLFFLGGLFGYALLIVMVNFNFTWLYFAYPIMMLLCAMPALIMLENEESIIVNHAPTVDMGEDWLAMMRAAYVSPMKYDGGFPLACVGVFTFSLGTSPMFFLLLIVRDLVGVHNANKLQFEFSSSSIVFFLMAAVAAVQSARKPATGTSPNLADAVQTRGQSLVYSLVIFSLVVFVLPMIALFSNLQVRTTVFFVLAGIFGFAFGGAFSRFQDLIWQVLPPPPEGDVGNAMGFNVMSRLFGVGVGNFIAGFILDSFYIGGNDLPQQQNSNYVAAVYSPEGYFAMCLFSAACAFAGTFFAWLAVRKGLPGNAVPVPAA